MLVIVLILIHRLFCFPLIHLHIFPKKKIAFTKYTQLNLFPTYCSCLDVNMTPRTQVFILRIHWNTQINNIKLCFRP
jgi:hypothetical protein